MGTLDLGFLSGVGNAVAGIAGAVGTYKSQKAANETNLKIAQETNAMQRKMFDDQLAYNWDMFNAENEYNSPAAMRKRYEEAGINPLLAMQEGNGQQVAAGGLSAPSAPSLVTPQVGAVDFSASAAQVGSGIASLIDNELKTKDIELKGQELKERIASAQDRLEGIKLANEKLRYDGKISESQYELNSLELKYRERYLQAMVTGQEISNEEKREMIRQIADQRAKIQMETLEIRELLPFKKRQYAAQTHQLNALARNLLVSANEMVLNGESQRNLNVHLAQKAMAESSKLGIDAKTARESLPYILAKLSAEAEHAGALGFTQWINFDSQHIAEIGDFLMGKASKVKNGVKKAAAGNLKFFLDLFSKTQEQWYDNYDSYEYIAPK